MNRQELEARKASCREFIHTALNNRSLLVVANRAPISFTTGAEGETRVQRSAGGLVTALTGLAEHAKLCWIASATTEEERTWRSGSIQVGDHDVSMDVQFVCPETDVYDGYYNVISNPLLWFLQHNIWDIARSPTITHDTWQAWEQGYVQVNHLFAAEIARQILSQKQPTLVMIQDYHLYLVPRFVRQLLEGISAKYTLMYFVHIPWPGTGVWGYLPEKMRTAILDGLNAVDLLGFQTREDALNFIRTCDAHMHGLEINFRRGWVRYQGHTTYIRDFPISIDIDALCRLAESAEVAAHRRFLENRYADKQLIVRIDRTEPSKNIVRGFQAFDELLDLYPEHRENVQFLALLVPSRMEVEEYQTYVDELMAAAGRVNVHHGNSQWEPVRVLVGEDYPRAIAALQIYDVLLVNSIADGMNLVAKEGPVVNQRDGVVILSERTGAHQQLEEGVLIISPADIHATAEALHQALIMPEDERQRRARRLRWLVEKEDIGDWLCKKLQTLKKLNL